MHFNIPDDESSNHVDGEACNEGDKECFCKFYCSLSWSDGGQEMPDPSKLQIPERNLVVIFVEDPSASGFAGDADVEDSPFVTIIDIPACSKMKQVFNNLIYPKHKFWRLYEWVGLNKSVMFHLLT